MNFLKKLTHVNWTRWAYGLSQSAYLVFCLDLWKLLNSLNWWNTVIDLNLAPRKREFELLPPNSSDCFRLKCLHFPSRVYSSLTFKSKAGKGFSCFSPVDWVIVFSKITQVCHDRCNKCRWQNWQCGGQIGQERVCFYRCYSVQWQSHSIHW